MPTSITSKRSVSFSISAFQDSTGHALFGVHALARGCTTMRGPAIAAIYSRTAALGETSGGSSCVAVISRPTHSPMSVISGRGGG